MRYQKRTSAKGRSSESAKTRRRQKKEAKRFRRRFDAVWLFFTKLLGHYEEEQADWAGVTLLEIIHGALRSLAHYVQDPRDREVGWEFPFIESQYAVDLDWEAFERRGEVRPLHATFTSEDLDDTTRASRKLVDAFFSSRYHFVLGFLTNHVVVLRQKGREVCIFPQATLEIARRLGRDRGRQFLLALREPYCIGTALLSDREVRPNRVVSRAVSRRLRKLMASPGLTFTHRIGRRRIVGSIPVVIKPLTIDLDVRRVFYPITVGVAFGNGRVPRLDRQTQRAFWKELLTELSEQIEEKSTWDLAFMGKAKVWDRNTARAKRRSRDLIAIADDRRTLASVGHRAFEELMAELYAGLGYRVRITRRSKDGGRDLILEKRDPVAIRVIVECKRPEPGNKVEVLPVRAAYGVQADEEPSKAVIVAATGFTPDGEDLVKRHKWRIEMVDRRRLMRLIAQYRSVVEAEQGARDRTDRRARPAKRRRRSRRRS